MDREDQTTDQAQTSRRPCLVDGCSCKDARIVSRRRAAYFAARARQTGQTAHRVVPIDAGWWLPGSTRREAIVPTPVLGAVDWPVWRLADLKLQLAATD